jgi:hypothetical protein
MKNILLAVFCFIGLVSPAIMHGQSFTVAVPSDTVYATVTTTGGVTNNITNITAVNDTLKWYVDSTNFPADWLTSTAFGICDDYVCTFNNHYVLWNPATSSGDTFTSVYYANAAHDSTGNFDLSMSLGSATSIGPYWITVNVIGQGHAAGTSKNLTFNITRTPTGVPVVPNASSDVLLYPNPATDELNIVYDATADVKNIAVYNIIGKVMSVYKVTGPSANLNLEAMPSGIYFVRLSNSYGQVVATKKFTKQ